MAKYFLDMQIYFFPHYTIIGSLDQQN